MPMRYADQDSVLHQLNQLSGANPEDAADVAAVVAIENAIATRIDDAIGHTFGVVPAAETRVARGASWPGSPRLILRVPARSITAIEHGGTWSGSVWGSPVVVTPLEYVTSADADNRIWEILKLDGAWPATVRVTGIWADQSLADIPADIVDIATWLTVEEYRYRRTSPAGVEGPDGMLVRPRNPWTSESVKRTVERYAVPRLVAP